MSEKKTDYLKLLTMLFYAAAAAAFIYIVVTQFPSLKQSLRLIYKADLSDALIVFCFIIVTYISAAQSYYFLSFSELFLSRTLIVEFAVSAVNKIIPSGIGGLATNYVYLRKHQNSRAQSTAVVAINNLLGFIANMVLLGILLTLVKSNPLIFKRPSLREEVIAAVIVLAVAAALLTELRHRILKAIRSILRELHSYRHRKDALVYSFISQISITLACVLALYFSLHAVHSGLSLSSVMLSYSFAVWFSTILPTPGGIGAVETGLTGALVAFGLKFDIALSAVLVFRLISFWIPFFIGALALIWSRKHKYL